MVGSAQATAGQRTLTEVEVAALRCLSETGNATATHWIAKACGLAGATDKARMVLRRLSTRGLAEPVRGKGSRRAYWWKITDSGKAEI